MHYASHPSNSATKCEMEGGVLGTKASSIYGEDVLCLLVTALIGLQNVLLGSSASSLCEFQFSRTCPLGVHRVLVAQ